MFMESETSRKDRARTGRVNSGIERNLLLL